ncbi:hypothetical protein GCM10009596_33490 [Arthrobacter rhombi]
MGQLVSEMMTYPTLCADRRRMRGGVTKAVSAPPLRNLPTSCAGLSPAGFANDSWSPAAIGWWGGEP